MLKNEFQRSMIIVFKDILEWTRNKINSAKNVKMRIYK